jgi:hypothetical protein
MWEHPAKLEKLPVTKSGFSKAVQSNLIPGTAKDRRPATRPPETNDAQKRQRAIRVRVAERDAMIRGGKSSR